MSNEEIKKQLAKIIFNKIHINAHMELAGAKAAVKAIATFYEQSILPEVLKEKDEKAHKIANLFYNEQHKVESLQSALGLEHQENVRLSSELSQLQSKMEEERERAAIEFAEWVNFKDVMQTNDGMWWRNNPAFRDKHFAQSTEHLFTLFKREAKSSTQSTESGNPIQNNNQAI